jgi:galactose mutarotase-like enzyme
VVLGNENEQDYLNDTLYLEAVAGCYANRIACDMICIHHIPYKLPVREGGCYLHGGVSGFNKNASHNI